VALPTFVNKGAFTSGTGNITVTLPASIAAGDLLLLFIESANEEVATPEGWNIAPSSPQGTGTAGSAGGVRLSVFWRIATASESDAVVGDSGNHTTGIMMAFRGVDTVAPFNANAGSTAAATTAASFPGVTTTIIDCLIVHGCAVDTDASSTATMGAATNANLGSITERHDQAVNTATGGGVVVITGTKATAGATGNTTATGSTSIARAYVTLALQPPQILFDAAFRCKASILPNALSKRVIAPLDLGGGALDLANGGLFGNGDRAVVTRDNSSSPAIYYSDDDGANWTSAGAVGNSTGGRPSRVAYNKGSGVLFVGSGSNFSSPHYYRSTDGASFTGDTIASGSGNTGLADSNGSIFLAGHSDGNAYASTDGNTWTDQGGLADSELIFNHLFGSEWGAYLRGTAGSTFLGFTTDDGANLTTVTGPPSQMYGLTYGNGLYVASTELGRMYTSPDKTTWTLAYTFPQSYTIKRTWCVRFFKGRFYVVFTAYNDPDYIAEIWSSADLSTWEMEHQVTRTSGYFSVNIEQMTEDYLVFPLGGGVGGMVVFQSRFELGSELGNEIENAAFSGRASMTASLSTGINLNVNLVSKANFRRGFASRAVPNGSGNTIAGARIVNKVLVVYDITGDNVWATHNGVSWRKLNIAGKIEYWAAGRANFQIDDQVFRNLAYAGSSGGVYTERSLNKWDSLPFDTGTIGDMVRTATGYVARLNQAAGADGMYYSTTIGGWSEVSGVASGTAWNLARNNASGYYIGVGGSETIPNTDMYVSTDNGQTWATELYPPAQSGNAGGVPDWNGSFWFGRSAVNSRVWTRQNSNPVGIWEHILVNGYPSAPFNPQWLDSKIRGYYHTGTTLSEYSSPDALANSFVNESWPFPEGVTSLNTDDAAWFDNAIWVGIGKVNAIGVIYAELEAGASPTTAALNCSSSMTAALTVGVRFASAFSAASSLTAQLQTSIRLATAAVANSSITAQLNTAIRLQSSLLAKSTIAAALSTAIRLQSQFASLASQSANLNTGIRLLSSFQSNAAATADLLTLTPVSSDQTGSYSIFATVGSELPGSYSVLVTAGDELDGSYSVLVAAGEELDGGYGMLAAVGEELDGAYALFSPVGELLNGSYGVLATVAEELDGGYGILSTVGEVLDGDYSVLVAVGADLDGSYGVVAAVGADLDGSYGVVATVGADLDGDYSIEVSGVTAVGADLDGSYGVLAKVSADLESSYAISASVSSDLLSQYGIAATVDSSLDGAYFIFQTAAADRTGQYSVFSAAGSSLTGSYSVSSSVASILNGQYGIAGTVGADQAGTYRVLNSAAADRAGSYAIVAAVGLQLNGAYSLFSAVGSIADGFYTVTEAVGQSLGASYSISVAVSVDQAGAYSVIQSVGSNLYGEYTIGFVAKPLKAWNGSEWEPGTLRRWDGSVWRAHSLRRWNGSAWE
jgi:hypothetical protein